MTDAEEAAYILGGDMARLMAAADLLRNAHGKAVRDEAERLAEGCCDLIQQLVAGQMAEESKP